MSVAVPAPNAAGQEALVYATVVDKPELQNVPQAEASGKQRDQRDQERQAPKDHISERLQSMARLAERRAAKEGNGASPSLAPQTSAPQQSTVTSDAARQAAEQAAARQAAARKSNNRPLQSLQGDGARQSTSVGKPKAQPSDEALSTASAPSPKPPQADAQSIDQARSSAYQAAVEAAAERRARQPGPAEMANLPDAVARYDSNGDGRIDQGEMKQVYRAKDERSSYAGLAQPRHTVPKDEPFFQEAAGQEPKKIFSGDDEPPLPGESRGEAAPPLPGTVEAEPLYTLPGEETEQAIDTSTLTSQERRALAEAQDPTLARDDQDLPPLFVPPEERALYEDATTRPTSEELATQEGLLQPRKLFSLTDETEQRDAALQTYRQINQGSGGRSSIIA